MISIYTSLFNYNPDFFDIPDAIENWLKYGNEIVVATLPQQKEKLDEIFDNHQVKVVECPTSLSDPLFDGKLKNAALQSCSNDYVIQQDFDERIGGDIFQWCTLLNDLKDSHAKAYMIDCIDLYRDYESYKGINRKWYLHEREGSFRGVVNYARLGQDKFMAEHSDSTELINSVGDLLPALYQDVFTKKLDINFPHIVHLGHVDIQRRKDINREIWRSVWRDRHSWGLDDRDPVECYVNEQEHERLNIIAAKHGLPIKWWNV